MIWKFVNPESPNESPTSAVPLAASRSSSARALLMGVINNGLDLLNVSSYYQQIVKGVIIVGAVLLDKRQRN